MSGEYRYTALIFDRGGWSNKSPDRFTPGKDPVPIVQEAGLALELVWTSHIRIRFSDRPTRSESLYRLSYPGPRGMSVRS